MNSPEPKKSNTPSKALTQRSSGSGMFVEMNLPQIERSNTPERQEPSKKDKGKSLLRKAEKRPREKLQYDDDQSLEVRSPRACKLGMSL